MNDWFSELGKPITEAESRLVRDYLGGLGIEPLPVRGVTRWQNAHQVAASPAWDHSWWDAEQRERQRLRTKAEASYELSQLLRLLSPPLELSDRVWAAAAQAAARQDCNEASLIASATGAACEAIYLAQLARLADEGSQHPFTVKRALFAAGRWPLGILNGDFYLF